MGLENLRNAEVAFESSFLQRVKNASSVAFEILGLTISVGDFLHGVQEDEISLNDLEAKKDPSGWYEELDEALQKIERIHQNILVAIDRLPKN